MSKTSRKIKSGVSQARSRKKQLGGVVKSYCYQPAAASGRTITEPAATVIESIERGLPIRELDDLQAILQVAGDELAFLLGISKATLHRRKAQGRLEPAESDRLLRFARLMGRAVAVFGGIEQARQWFNAPQFGLGGSIPLEYARTEAGAREVENLLGRIEFGVYS